MKKAADINFDADFFTKHKGISSRGLWTVEEVEKAALNDESELMAEVMANDSVEFTN